MRLWPSRRTALLVSSFLTWSGVSVRVPLEDERDRAGDDRRRLARCRCRGSSGRRSRPAGWSASMYELGTRRPWRCEPGATKSGASQWRRSFGHAEKAPTVSSASVGVPIESVAADGDHVRVEGGVRERRRAALRLWKPLLPAAATTTMPCFQACSAAYASGSTCSALRRVRAVGEVEHADVQAGVVPRAGPPSRSRRSPGETSVPPSAVPTLSADDPRVGRHAPVGRGRRVGVRARQRRVVAGDQAGHERAVAVGVEVASGSAPATRARGRARRSSLPGASRPATGETPVSISATSTPLPV